MKTPERRYRGRLVSLLLTLDFSVPYSGVSFDDCRLDEYQQFLQCPFALYLFIKMRFRIDIISR